MALMSTEQVVEACQKLSRFVREAVVNLDSSWILGASTRYGECFDWAPFGVGVADGSR